MRTRWQGWAAAIVVTLGTVALVMLDVDDSGFRHWWVNHAFTTDTVAGVLVVLLTVLVVNQLVRRRQILDRSQAVAAQTAIVVTQAARTCQAVSASLDGSGDKDAANDAFRTYMTMLLASAQVLIEERLSRTFLEEAQRLAAEMARALAGRGSAGDNKHRLDESLSQVRAAAQPLVQPLNLEAVIRAGEGEASPS
jgi:hypothetical protein